jgi:hypothetical protein
MKWNSQSNFIPGAAVAAAVLLLISVGSAIVGAKGKQPHKTDGTYEVSIGGYYAGTGTIGVASRAVSIAGKVTPRDMPDSTLDLSAPGLPLDGDHFEGTGTVGGKAVRVQGRLDGYAKEKHFKGARVLASYIDESGRRGRIAGTLTRPAPSPGVPANPPGGGDAEDDDD